MSKGDKLKGRVKEAAGDVKEGQRRIDLAHTSTVAGAAKGDAATAFAARVKSAVRETVEKPVDEVQSAVEETPKDLPPGQEKKEEPAPDDNDSILGSTVEGGSIESKGDGKPK